MVDRGAVCGALLSMKKREKESRRKKIVIRVIRHLFVITAHFCEVTL
jgi:hypothetical protein